MMLIALLTLAILALLVNLWLMLQLVQSRMHVVSLNDCPPAGEALPSLSVLIAARNEERDLEPALRSLLAQDYAPLELIAVDDRSTDRTGEILDRLASEDPRLRVVHIRELPPGWLGKNHAQYAGAREAKGELLLLTDADIVMERSVLRRAVGYLVRHKLDHLALAPALRMPGLLLESFGASFLLYFTAYFQPWKAKNPGSSAHVGIGAFNLVRAEVYRQLGGHEPIRMRPDDDMKLGKLIKRSGYRQEIVDAVDLIWVPWYGSLGEVIRGLEKNAFAGVDYSVFTTVASSVVALVVNVWPYAAVFLTSGWVQVLYLASVLLMIGMAAACARQLRSRPLSALFAPLSTILMIYIQWRTMLLTLLQGGIRWRDTFYPLSELKANKV